MDKLKKYSKVILYDGEDKLQLPTRDDFMPDKDLRLVESQVKAGEPILFNANTAKEYVMDSRQGTQILLIGHTHCGRKASLLLNNIEIYIDIFPADIIFDRKGELSELLHTKEFIEMNNMDKLKKLLTYKVYRKYHEKLMAFISANRCSSHSLIYKYIYELGVHERVLGYRLFFKTIKAQKEAVSKYDSGKLTGAYTYPEFFVTSYSSKTTNFVDSIAARNDLHIGSWMKITKYSISSKPATKCHYNFIADIKNYQQAEPDDMLNIYRSLYCFFDIETANLRKKEDLKAESNNKNILSADNIIFNIGSVFNLESSDSSSIFRVNIINTGAKKEIAKKYYRTFEIPDSLTIVTTSSRNTLLAFIKLLESTRIDFLSGFNSSDFDIPQLLFSLRIENLFDLFYSLVSVMISDNLMSYKYSYTYNNCTYRHNSAGYTFWSNAKTTSQVSGIAGVHKNEDRKLMINNGSLPEIKIKAKESKSYHDINIPGITLLDVMLISWKKDVKKSAKGGGLNFFLKEYGFQEKLDIPYYKIWIFYQYSVTHDVFVAPSIVISKCEHGSSTKHSYIADDGKEYWCKNHKKYYIGNKEIDKVIYEILGGKSLNENIRDVAIYCSYDAEASMLLLKKYKFMEEKRKYCVYVNMTLHKVIYLADMNKAENGLRKTITESNYVFIEEKQVYSREGNNTPIVKRLLAANPRLEHYHMNHKAPRNKGGHCEIKVKGKITMEFKFDISTIDQKLLVEMLINDRIYYEIDGGILTVRIPGPVEGIDFASLYPSLVMAFGLCKSKITFDADDIARAVRLNPDLKYMTLPASELLDDSDAPDLICEYYERTCGIKDFRSANIYIISHDNNKDLYGILPKFMGDFFDKRKICKNLQFKATDMAEELLSESMVEHEIMSKYEEMKGEFSDLKSFVDAYLFANSERYRNFKIEIINQEGRQLAIKITMNSTYGTLDTIHSSFYSPIVASLITFFGRRYVKISGKYCEDNGCVVVYHDTDSTYFHHNKSVFESIVRRYIFGDITKSQMYKKLVMRSIKKTYTSGDLINYYKNKISAETDELRIKALERKLLEVPKKCFVDKLNDLFAELSGSYFLRQIREETLFPVIYSMLKKYFGVIHGTSYTENFSIKDVLFRGLKIRAGNCTGFLSSFSSKIVRRVLEENDVRKIVFEELDMLLSSEPDYNNLSMYENSARYKVGTKNSVFALVARMEAKRDGVADPKLRNLLRSPFQLESVLYINTEPKKHYDIMGRKYSPNKQELAEYSRVVDYLYKKHLIDGSDYYKICMKDYVLSTVSTCAQLLSSDTSFEGYYEDIKHKDYVKVICNELKRYCKDYYNDLPENVEKEEHRIKYGAFIRNNKTIFRDIFSQMIDDPNMKDMAVEMLMRMINVKTNSFSVKLENIAKTGFIGLPSLGDLFSAEGMDETDIDIIRRSCIEIETALRNHYNWLNRFREDIVEKMTVLVNKIYMGELEIADIEYKISPIDVAYLSYCEILFRIYCGRYTFLTGVTKNYYNSITINVPDL
jgi:DNA polymerase elongation subunit (family B)